MIIRDYQIKALKHFRKYLRMRKIFKILDGNPLKVQHHLRKYLNF